VDWYVNASDDVDAVSSLRREIREYLQRHAEPGSDVDGAELIAAELLQNGVMHAGAPVWVSLSWPGPHPILTVADLGPGFDIDAELPDDPLALGGGRGLFIVSRLARQLEAARRRVGGSIVHAELPVTQAVPDAVAVPERSTGALPHLDEALPEGGFGKESFLRALVVQLAQAVERREGPLAAEAAVTQVGTDVGGQMEAEYRAATNVVGRMTPEHMADCYVRLKHAIDGRFSVVEANSERIVLVNDACPFGDVVQRAPGLCRMTSSVFGGIAARNHDRGAQVVLEERIALGDAQCRVVVRLDADATDTPVFAHRYPPAVDQHVTIT
jgi:anti-sigma regulatory factor (Ser/Thr protein kinase)